MRIIRDDELIENRQKLGKITAWVGLGGLMGSLAISIVKPEWGLITLTTMIVGFALSVIGGGLADRYVGPLARHTALEEVLKGLNRRYILLQYILPSPHVLWEPGGFTVFVVKSQGGEVLYNLQKDKWQHQQKGKLFRQFAGEERLGKPDEEAELEVKNLNRWLQDNLPDLVGEVPVRSAIVFANPDVELEARDAPVPTFYRKNVKDWLRANRLSPLPEKTQGKVEEALGVEEE